MTKLAGPQNVFVYGSLLSGLHNHPALTAAKAQFMGPATTVEKYHMVSLGAYPGVILTQATSAILGEMYRVDGEAMERILDRLEGYPYFYNRREVPLDNGELAWIYYLQYTDGYTDSRTPVPDGDWRKFFEAKHAA